MIKNIVLAATILASFGFSTTLAAGKATIPYDEDFSGIRMPWRNGGETLVIYKVIRMGDKAGVCGGYLPTGGSSRVVERSC